MNKLNLLFEKIVPLWYKVITKVYYIVTVCNITILLDSINEPQIRLSSNF